MKKDKWVWMPHAGHLIVGRDCQFHLNTCVGNYLVSTVGEYWPDYLVREIIAQTKGVTLEGIGDAREVDFLQKCGYESIGCDRLYETMVFKAKKAEDKCCPYTAETFTELDMQGYNTAGEAYQGHLDLCKKWSRKR
jgi:hypothetical protein